MELAGHECVGFCEFDKYAVASYTAMHLLTDEQREYIQSVPVPLKKNGEPNLRDRQKEILKEEYKNGEWYADDVRRVDAGSVPRADCWCFGFPCQDISIAGNCLGFAGKRSSLFFAVTGLIRDIPEEDKPSYLLIENVKNLLSVNRGLDFAKLLIELDEIGYDAEWNLLNSKHFGVPQNRERVFVVGHLRGRGTRKVFPLGETDGIHNSTGTVGKIYETTQCLNKMDGGGREPMIPVRMTQRSCKETVISPTLTARGPSRGRENSSPVPGVMIREATKAGYAIAEVGDSVNLEQPNSKTRRGRVGKGVAQTLTTGCQQGTLDGTRIRRLTPRECFRLQGWPDYYFDRAAMVNSDSQLYKQAGNGVTVNVVQAIAERMDMED